MNTKREGTTTDHSGLIYADLVRCLEQQRRASVADPNPGYLQRKADLLALKRLVGDNREALIAAISKDYGNRARNETFLAEIVNVLDGINFIQKHLQHWMKPQRRHVDFALYPGARNRLIPQPLGVVGVIVPWNFPLQLALSPLSCVFAAGNRAMIKMSENSGHLAQLLIQLARNYFPPEKLAIFAETGEIGVQFSRLPFDHLLFTGSGDTGRAVMAAAARNLTPVTLELGGKSPAVIAPDFPLQKAAERIMFAKVFNAGQICINVDYVFVPENKVEAFVSAARGYVQKNCPDIQSPNYTSIIDQRAFERLRASLADAEKKGAQLINLTNGQQADDVTRKFPPLLILNSSDEMELLKREIFGPILPVLPYSDPREVVDYVGAHDRPLAFYPFTNDRKLQDYYLDHIMSGGVCVNDVLLQFAQHDLPFGGVGASGMGQYHAHEGFMTFSKLRPVFYQARFSALKLLTPLHGKWANRLLALILKGKI
jgi:coniferyl-aldehyde dehydrogenase